ncbi:MAG: hypothetical protein ACRD15_01090, partial [Vicinamibacterales bacterium]
MAHLDTVTEDADAGRSHLGRRGPAGLRVEWDAEIINEVENQTLGWRSLAGSDVVTAGSVSSPRHARIAAPGYGPLCSTPTRRGIGGKSGSVESVSYRSQGLV